MQRTQRLTAIIERVDDGFVSLCPELDIASQGASIEEAGQTWSKTEVIFRNSGPDRGKAALPRRRAGDTGRGPDWVSFDLSRAWRSATFSNSTASARCASVAVTASRGRTCAKGNVY